MKLKNQGKRLGGLLFLSFFLAPGVQAKDNSADVSWYANINRALMHVDDGHQKDTYFVDNDSMSSRAGIMAEKKLDECLSFGGKVELGIKTASTSAVNQLDRKGTDTVQIRHVDTWLQGDFGKLSLGRGSTASENAVASDLSDTAPALGAAGPWLPAGGMYFHQKSNANPVTAADPTVASVFSPFGGNGLGRKDRIRYDSPSFVGFSLSGSINSSENDTNGASGKKHGSDIALTYANEFNGVKLLGAVAYAKLSKDSDQRNQKVLDTSLAALHVNTGINLAVNYASNKLANPDVNAVSKTQKFHRVQLGLISDLNRYGATNFVVDYTHSKHAIINDAKGKAYGFGVVQKLKKVNSEVYFMVRRLKYKKPTQNYDNMLVGMTGVRVSLGGKLS